HRGRSPHLASFQGVQSVSGSSVDSMSAETSAEGKLQIRFARGTAAPAPTPTGTAARLPGLDGLRAIAISIVLVTHALGTKNFFPFVRAPILGDMGVRAFFVLSGFIITSLLMAEQRKNGKI